VFRCFLAGVSEAELSCSIASLTAVQGEQQRPLLAAQDGRSEARQQAGVRAARQRVDRPPPARQEHQLLPPPQLRPLVGERQQLAQRQPPRPPPLLQGAGPAQQPGHAPPGQAHRAPSGLEDREEPGGEQQPRAPRGPQVLWPGDTHLHYNTAVYTHYIYYRCRVYTIESIDYRVY